MDTQLLYYPSLFDKTHWSEISKHHTISYVDISYTKISNYTGITKYTQ